MSIALSTARPNVRQLIRDVDASALAVKGYVLDQAISNHYQLVHARLGVPMEWLTVTAFVADDAEYTLTTPEFHSIGAFRLASNYAPVEEVSPLVMARLRVNTTDRGTPFAVALTEELPASVGTTKTTIQLYPTPNANDTLQGLYAAAAGVLSDAADKIQIGTNGARAIEYEAAAELLEGMTERRPSGWT